jgi:hypothetical protein
MTVYIDLSLWNTTLNKTSARSGGPITRANIKAINLVNSATHPLVREEKVYFPIKRIPSNTSQVPILGRPFFLAFCMFTDYERMKFSIVSQITSPNSRQRLVAAYGGQGTTSSSDQLSRNAVIGRTVGAVAGSFLIFLAFLLMLYLIPIILIRREKKRAMLGRKEIEFEDNPQLDGKALGKSRSEATELDGLHIYEMDAKIIPEMASNDLNELEGSHIVELDSITRSERVIRSKGVGSASLPL